MMAIPENKPVSPGSPGPMFLLSISLVSAAALGYEILLMRLLSIIQWHHFAYMIISLALLGYGISGTFLTLFSRWITSCFTVAYLANIAGFGVTSIVCFSIAQHLPFNPLAMAWEPVQQLNLMGIYLVLTVPFFFAANCVGLALRHFVPSINRLYGADLLGAALGAVAAIAVLFLLPPEQGVRFLALSSIAAVLLAGADRAVGLSRVALLSLILVSLLIWAAIPGRWLDVQPSPYKGLSQVKQVIGTELVAETDSPLGRLSVVQNQEIPLRIAPGLSLNSENELPLQLGIFTDGEGASAINNFNGDLSHLGYLEDLTSALPYYLLGFPRTLVIGTGGGTDVLQALYFGAAHVDGLEINPAMTRLVEDEFAGFSGGLFTRPNVQIHHNEARHYIAGYDGNYDLIQLSLVDSHAASSAAMHALNETYLYTVEAFESYLNHLEDGGILSITRWLKLPPRDSLKLLATAREALQKQGVVDPAGHVALIRSWNTTTLLVKKAALTQKDIAAITRFCRQRSFDTAYYPGITAEETNRYNQLEQPVFYQGAYAILNNESDFFQRYKFNIQPATDDRPYFFQFFKWRSLPELLSMQQQGGLPLLEWGYLILVATLAHAALASVLLILIPLLGVRHRHASHGHKRPTFIYFAALGLAFLFVEISFIQKFILFLGQPIYAVTTVVCSFLLFAGLGSRFALRFSRWTGSRGWSATTVAGTITALTILIYLIALPGLLDRLLGLPDASRFVMTFVMIAPLGFMMGLPFPLGLMRLARRNADLIPWAWGINGCASVMSAILATLIAIHAGFTWVTLLAALLYLAASRVYRES